MYLLSFPRFWTLSIEGFLFLFSSILNGVTLKTSNTIDRQYAERAGAAVVSTITCTSYCCYYGWRRHAFDAADPPSSNELVIGRFYTRGRIIRPDG